MTRALALFDGPAPRIYAAPWGAPLADAAAAGVLARLAAVGGGPADLLDVTVLVSTRRAMRALRAAFARASGGVALGPRMAALTEAGEGLDSPAAPDAEAPPPPAIAPLDRLLALTTLTRALLQAEPHLAAPSAAPRLASDVAALLDECAAARVPLDALDAAAPDDQAAHWRDTARFLEILRTVWPNVLAERGLLDPGARRRLLVDRLEARWDAAPPAGPVLAVGSPTDALATRLMARVAALPNGAVLVPGADPDLAPDVAAALAEGGCPEHPQAAFVALLNEAGLTPVDARPWSETAGGSVAARRRLWAEALRPAPVTDAWRDAATALGADADAAARGLTWLEAETPRQEAAAIAVALREALETPERTAALVTPDRTLARRVAGDLARWGVNPDDSSGRPLALTPPGVALKLTLSAARADADGPALMALLSHPLARFGLPRGLHLRLKRRADRHLLRGLAPLQGADDLAARAEALETAAALEDRAPAPDMTANLVDWAERVKTALQPLTTALAADEIPLAEMVAAHRTAALAVADAGEDGADAADAPPRSPLFDKAAGEALARFLDRFAAAAADLPPLAPADYPPLLLEAMAAEAVREPYGRHARIAILGPLEARMLSADLVVLGGLNEGVWPPVPEPGPWLSRGMRARVGLPPLETRVGLSANDFLQAAMAPRAILSRALKSDGAPTTPSRWLLRLETLLAGVAPDALKGMRARAQPLLAAADALDRPAAPRPPAPRPCPRPPTAARPRRYSVTDIERLIRDPYAIYAKRVLRLRPLPALESGFGLSDRGVRLHELMEQFVAGLDGAPPGPDAAARYDAFADALLADIAPAPTQHALWRARAAEMRDAVIEGERERATLGRPIGLEKLGALSLETLLGPVTLTAFMDRIDQRSGAYAVFDYKTGRPPTQKQIEQFAKQMPLQAAILIEAGAEGLAPAPVAHLSFIHLRGGERGAPETVVASDPSDAAQIAAEAKDGLIRLISAYADPKLGYLARARPKLIGHEGDFDDLARYGEWTDGEEGR